MRRANRPSAQLRTAVWPLVRIGLLVVAVLVPAHDLVYLAAYGFARRHEALVASGHGAYWTAIAIGTLLGIGALAAVAAHRSRRLRRRLAELGGLHVDPIPAAALVGRIATLWLLLLATSLVVFVVQENFEHARQHPGHLPGLTALYAPDYQWALPIFAALSLAAAAIGSLTLARLHALADAVARAEGLKLTSAAEPIGTPTFELAGTRRIRSTPDLGRAPPLPLHP